MMTPPETTSALGYICLVPLYFVSMFLTVFFNVAFYNEILKALNGQPVSITGGIKFALTRWKAILFWSLLAGLVGVVIKFLEDKFGFFGSWILRIIGVSWNVASVFVAPVIIRDREENNPVQCLKKSAGVIRRTWGEGLIGYAGISGLAVLATLLAIVFISVVIVLSILEIVTFGFIWIIVLILCLFFWLAFTYVLSVIEKIYIGALYIYGTEGVIAEAFDKETLDMAWKVKDGAVKKSE